MFSATLATFITVTSVPTNTPYNVKNDVFLSSFFDISKTNILDLLSVVFTVAIGVAAIIIAIKSNKISNTAVAQSLSTLEHEKSMRKLENKISVIDKAFDVYYYFTRKACFISYYSDCTYNDIMEKMNEAMKILYTSRFIFKNDVYLVIESQYRIIIDSLHSLKDFVDNRKLKVVPSPPKTKDDIEFEAKKLENINSITDSIKNMILDIELALGAYKLDL